MAMETLDDEKPEEEEVIDKENKEGSEKLNRSSFVSANTPSKICHTFPGNGRCQRLSFKTKAAGSVEGNVLDKESASISDKIAIPVPNDGTYALSFSCITSSGNINDEPFGTTNTGRLLAMDRAISFNLTSLYIVLDPNSFCFKTIIDLNLFPRTLDPRLSNALGSLSYRLASREARKAKIEAQILAAEAAAKMKAEVELKKQREREEKLLELHYKR
ncbi:hypothetical protein GOBAR_AA20750 [Gossypium barbadense]|uniref:Uncharacterized protein n=1 Tax=Gossypium barbadense TaxID=3634 RepID=A0A2P5X9B2_GOSBA|nr:hypothetical protein GOBAR_AA20750 [Gossypium barbadense]